MAITLLDTENADRNLTTSVTVLTHTPSASLPKLCQGFIAFGDGTKNLNGTGGNFEIVITVGNQTIQPSPEVIVFSTAPRAGVWTDVFAVPANAEVVLKAKSPNGGDTDVDVTAYLFDLTAAAVADIAAIKTKTDQFVFTAANKVDASVRDWKGTTPSDLISGRVDANAQVVGDKTSYALSSGGVQAIWDALSSALTTSGSIGKRLVDFVTGDIFGRLGAPAGASVSADVAAVKADTAAVKAKTDNLPAAPANEATLTNIQGRLPAALVSGRMDAAIGAFPMVVDTGVDGAAALKEMMSKATGDFTKNGAAYTFKDRSGNALFTLTAATTTRTRS